MSFDQKSFAQVSAGYADSLPQSYVYETADTLATVLASGYFDTVINILDVNDLIYITASDGQLLVRVTSVTTHVTVEDFTAIRYAELTITSAQILAMRATPVTLVPAQGTGTFVEFVSAILILDYNSAAYVEATDNLAVRLNNGSGAIVSQTIEMTGFIDQAASTITNGLPKIDAIVAASAATNKALVLHNIGTTEFTTGNSPLFVKVAYRVHATGL